MALALTHEQAGLPAGLPCQRLQPVPFGPAGARWAGDGVQDDRKKRGGMHIWNCTGSEDAGLPMLSIVKAKMPKNRLLG
ncbi:hypothetical protein D3C87_2109830 [compost metagenome]